MRGKIFSDVKRTKWTPSSFISFALEFYVSLQDEKPSGRSVKLKIDLFSCRKKKIFYPKKIFTFSQVTQRNFSWKSLRVRTKIDPMFRPEYIFNPLHQGRTYSLENNIFCITVDIYLLTEGIGFGRLCQHSFQHNSAKRALF